MRRTVLRVIALRPRPRQTFRQRIASCWRSIEAGDVAWDRSTRRLSVERTSFETESSAHLRTIYRIGEDGSVARTNVERLP